MLNPPDVSHWHATLDDTSRRPALEGNETADVVIIGAGYTGLWTAYYLAAQNPTLKISVVEAQFVGFGASGRNGGWCSPDLSGLDDWFDDPATRNGAMVLNTQMLDAVDEVGRIAQRENIDCDYAKDGQIAVAVTARQEKKLRKTFAGEKKDGTDGGAVWLQDEDIGHYINVHQARAAVLWPQCAVVHPAKLVTGLAQVVERQGVKIFERSAVTHIAPGKVQTEKGAIAAGQVMIATEAYSAKIPQLAKRLVPIHSQLIVTEPLSDDVWRQIGLKDRLLFSDGRALVTYGQRTVDRRIAFGYRASYLFGSGIRDVFSPKDPSFETIRRILVSLFPVLAATKIDRCWGGALGVARNLQAFVQYDAATRIGWAGGYTGNGVAASNLAGRTMADLLLGEQTERVTTPWVKIGEDPLSAFPKWEPEPLRWVAVQGVRGVLEAWDWLENSSLRRTMRS